MAQIPTRIDSTRVIIQIKRVWLAVRFNCKLSFIIRNELSEKIAETDNTYNLFRGECLVNQTLYFELTPEVLAARAKKLKLVVMMISANGMVPAGFINFNTHPKSPYEQFEAIMPLERCDDARAQIKFMHMYENCIRTPIENSYINHLINKQDRHLHDNMAGLSKVYQQASHSVNRENVSARKYRNKDADNYGQTHKTTFNKPLISPRQLPRNSQIGTAEKSVKINSFKKQVEDKIAEQKQPNDSSINPLTKDQLMKEHQEYWLEIIRMEQEMENIKEENRKLKEENATLKSQSTSLKEYYEGHEEKIHAFVGEIQQNSETIKKLQAQIKQLKTIIAQKEELEKQFQKLMEIQSNEVRHNLNKHADLQQKLHSAQEEKKTHAIKLEMFQETITFLQNEMKKYDEQNAHLKGKIKSDEERLQFLIENNETQKNTIHELQDKISRYNEESDIITTFQIENAKHKQQIQSLKKINEQYQSKLQAQSKEIISHVESKQLIILQSSLKQEETISKHQQSFEELRKTYDALLHSSSVEQSKYKILQKQLEFATKEKDAYKLQLRKKQQEFKELKNKFQQLEDERKHISIKLLEYDASLRGKSTTIDQLKGSLAEQVKAKKDLLDKNASLEKQFEEIAEQLSKQEEEKNNITIQLTTLQENLRSIEDERAYLNKAKQQLLKYNAELKNQIESLKKARQQGDKNHQMTQQELQRQLAQSQQQLSDVIEKASMIQMELESTLAQLSEQKNARNTVHDQYQQSYNQSMTALTLKHGKLEKQLEEVNKNIQKEKNQNKALTEKLALKQTQVNDLKTFTHNKLQENLKLMKQINELKSKSSETAQNIEKLQAQISNKNAELLQANKLNDELSTANRQSLTKIDQLTSELQFVTEVLQRERQQKSDIEKEFDHLQKADLPQIAEVGQFKQESFDENRQDDVHLQIESKFVNQNQQANSKEEPKSQNQKKKKKKQ